ncbi:hypothetical protein HGM15179_019154 [Zosterops borbonicus]|uniref:RNase H type-1 domain-containing protein n=2 Tax=Zosterops borbonicus TaxID=364589 RepID=A0A8K1D9W9_9PASS|nr:hypothetical protein HGM15179_019154 [Zosterops borbonicus]
MFVKPLYALIMDEIRELQWTKEATRAFDQLKKALMSASALGLPDVSKPFFLFSHGKQGITLGILPQNLGPYWRAVAYPSKQLDTAAKGWPGCLRAVAAVTVNIQEARKFTLGQKMTVLVSQQDDVEIVVTNIVNPASFLSGSMGEPVIHDCLETIKNTYSSHPDLKDTPIEDAETWFTDGSSYVVSGKQHAGYAVTTSREVIESGPLPTNTSAQKADAFEVVHAHRAIWKERGLLNSQEKSIKHSQEILKLLDAVQLPKRVAIMHISSHQKVSSELEEGNMLVDREAKHAATGEVPNETIEAALIPDGKISIEVPRKAVIPQVPAIPEAEEQITPLIKKTGVQNLIINPKWSLKRVEMGVQVKERVPIATSTVHLQQYWTNGDAMIPIHKMIHELESQGVVSKPHSPFNSPIWPVCKLDREGRLTVDYRGLNEVTPPLSSAVPDMLELQYDLESC